MQECMHDMHDYKNGVFDCNSDISWSIFTLFAPMETGMNAL